MLFLGSEQDTSCWNCGGTNRGHMRFRKPFNPAVIAARKSLFLGKKNNIQNCSKRVLYQLVRGLDELVELEAGLSDYIASTFFGDKTDES